MSSLLGSGGGRGGGGRGGRRADAENRAVDAGYRRHLARDINDVRALERPVAGPIPRGRHWTWLALTAAGLAAAALASGGRGDAGVPITADCAHPGIAVASSRVAAGTPLRYRLTGADGVRYAVTLDGAPVPADGSTGQAWTPTPAGPAVQLQACVSPTLAVPAPAVGPHELAMRQVADDGTTRQVAAVTVTVG